MFNPNVQEMVNLAHCVISSMHFSWQTWCQVNCSSVNWFRTQQAWWYSNLVLSFITDNILSIEALIWNDWQHKLYDIFVCLDILKLIGHEIINVRPQRNCLHATFFEKDICMHSSSDGTSTSISTATKCKSNIVVLVVFA